MLSISIPKLFDALANAPTFKPQELNAGAQYIQDEIHNKLANGIAVNLKELNFSAFELEDISTFRDFYSDMERHDYKCEQVGQSLQRLKPIALPGTFV